MYETPVGCLNVDTECLSAFKSDHNSESLHEKEHSILKYMSLENNDNDKI